VKCVEFTRLVSFTTGPASGFCACLSRTTFSTKDFGPVASRGAGRSVELRNSSRAVPRFGTDNIWRKRRISVTQSHSLGMSTNVTDDFRSTSVLWLWFQWEVQRYLRHAHYARLSPRVHRCILYLLDSFCNILPVEVWFRISCWLIPLTPAIFIRIAVNSMYDYTGWWFGTFLIFP